MSSFSFSESFTINIYYQIILIIHELIIWNLKEIICMVKSQDKPYRFQYKTHHLAWRSCNLCFNLTYIQGRACLAVQMVLLELFADRSTYHPIFSASRPPRRSTKRKQSPSFNWTFSSSTASEMNTWTTNTDCHKKYTINTTSYNNQRLCRTKKSLIVL